MEIDLFCNAGLSTSILVKNMLKEAKLRNIEAEIEAYPIEQLKQKAKTADVVLLGPQVSYRFKEAEKICGELNVPVAVIDMQVYGMCDGKKALETALKLKK